MRAIVMLLMLSMGLCPPALGQDTAKWGKVGGSEIRVHRTVGDGCFPMQISAETKQWNWSAKAFFKRILGAPNV